MSAKHKLNAAYFAGCMLLAGLAGHICDSLAVFVLTLVCLIGTSIYGGDIRR